MITAFVPIANRRRIRGLRREKEVEEEEGCLVFLPRSQGETGSSSEKEDDWTGEPVVVVAAAEVVAAHGCIVV